MDGSRPMQALVVGAISLDLDARSGSAGFRPGGVVYHAGLALSRLGADTRVVTSVSPRDAHRLLSPLHAEGIETATRRSAQTTTYRNDYSGHVDRHELCASSDPIRPEDVPAAWLGADVVPLGPLHRRDIEPDLLSGLRGLVGIDVQGLVRVCTARGTELAPCADLPRFLAHVEVVQASEAELPALLAGATLEQFVRRHAVREMIVTRGPRGARVIEAGRVSDVPAPAVEARYKVGAGDVFLAASLVFRVRGEAPVEAARAATRVCAAKLERGEVPKGLDPRSLAP
jgi:sugar/nucleoside kinase (ribokinase family)